MLGPARFFFAALVLASALLGIAIMVAVHSRPAKAHDWYPMECCSMQDCAPVERVERLKPMMGVANALVPETGLMIVTTKHGSVVVPEDFKTRESKDGRMHACMTRRHDTIDSMRLICLFVPPLS